MNINKPIIEEKDFYRTSDLALAVSLSLFCPIEAIDKPPHSNRGSFLFKKSKQLEALVESYHRGEMRVSPAIYFNQLKIIKTRLYAIE